LNPLYSKIEYLFVPHIPPVDDVPSIPLLVDGVEAASLSQISKLKGKL
jgi:hypothetical protein